MDLPIHTGHRSRRGFMSDVLSPLTGLATKDSVNAVVHVLRQIEAGIYESARLWGDGARSLTPAFRIQQDRMSNVVDILDAYRKTIRGIQYEFMASHNRSVSVQMRQNRALSSALYFLSNNTQQLLEMESLYNGIETLMTGRISHYLLPHDYLQGALADVQNYLHVRQRHLTLSRTDYVFYYNEAKFRTFRHRSTLFVVIDVPVTAKNFKARFQIYDLITVPLQTPNREDYYSSLATDITTCLLYTSPSPRDRTRSRMPSSA